ncbi:zinc finger BED domain-containing 4-like isoform X1 [Solea senegalensis]|uniref:Zinc finger BED domain-containing 4-like isoform X1 n=2 Tax=Solea senegalensis TaxID=28829 RepID=A0AAV6Q2U6_SOLSE|nr:zinc finger BED domain-containing protein [Solea senegalensis]KAG7482691.1 zinc finger BED domain-containing 4-like isoform X1 [Solea senegalensis]
MSRRRSVVWGFFKAVDSLSVRCVLCSDYQSKQVRGSTTNMLRHLRVKHPQEFAKTFRGRSTKSTRRIDRRAVNTDSEQSYYSVDVVLENEDSDNSIPLNESDINAAISDILEAAQGDAAEEDSAHAEVSDEPPVRHGRPRRSLIWRHYERLDGLDAAQCRICMKKLQCFEGSSTSNLRRHLSARHPEMFAGLVASGLKPPPSTAAVKTEVKQGSVDVVLENEDSDNSVPLNESDINAAEEDSAHAEVSDEPPVRHGRPRRSLIWRHYERLDGLDAAQCRICMKKLQCFEGSSTSNLRRHLSARHPEMFAGLVASGLKPPPSTAAVKTEVKQGSVDVVLENEDSDNSIPLNESDINAAISDILEAAQGDAAEEDSAHAEVSDEPPVRHGRPRRSLIWRHYERLDGLDAAQCRICMKKLQCFEGTSNLRRHLSARHPEMFAGLVASGLKPPPSTAAVKTELKPGSGSFEGEKRVWRRERELIEALRRTQKEEARALEVQRDLLEKMRAADAREATAEREKIEALRKAQQEEAKELTLQREELQKEKAELRKKQEELEQEREELVLFSRGQECSTITSGL